MLRRELDCAAGNVVIEDIIVERVAGQEHRLTVKTIDRESHKNYVHFNGTACYHVADRVKIR